MANGECNDVKGVTGWYILTSRGESSSTPQSSVWGGPAPCTQRHTYLPLFSLSSRTPAATWYLNPFTPCREWNVYVVWRPVGSGVRAGEAVNVGALYSDGVGRFPALILPCRHWCYDRKFNYYCTLYSYLVIPNTTVFSAISDYLLCIYFYPEFSTLAKLLYCEIYQKRVCLSQYILIPVQNYLLCWIIKLIIKISAH